MEKVSVTSDKSKKSIYPIDFSKGAIQIRYFEKEFLFVNFEEEQRVKFPLSAFEFETDNIKTLRKQYKPTKTNQSENVEKEDLDIVFSDDQFVPIQEFKDVDQILHIPEHFVYLLRWDLTSNGKSKIIGPGFREWPRIYKFDFKKLEYRLVFIFSHDLFQPTISRFTLEKRHILSVKTAYSNQEIQFMNQHGFLILGGKGANLPGEPEDGFLKTYYFFCTTDGAGNVQDKLFKMMNDSKYPCASHRSAVLYRNDRTYIITNGGYIKTEPKSKLERKYKSIKDFTVVYYHEDFGSINWQEEKNGDEYSNLAHYLLVPNYDHIYLFGGESMIEADDLQNDYFNTLKFKINFDYIRPDSISLDETFSRKRLRKTLLFDKEWFTDHWYLSYNDGTIAPRSKIFGLCNLAGDPHEVEVMEYDTIKEKATVKNLRINYRPMSYITREVSYEENDLFLRLPVGITEELF